ncbi:DegT/DnrJ/EryC1/StrS family aminotransferase [Salibacteraceae bacterium]|nr:capsular biosynthesis protein [Crocinitomicaceae bacterium]MCH9822368.1 DegT/DnrJ/EryC1/StrS family aminotransferase [Bacteroidota bacterium]MDC1204967.1 DegT/DnrJ/EryC1/StrS family aminotransferase [Salibacteraceae bacterium]|tara:strand:- start:49335 stop:50546 length:1212 start_codon:yes stop_codon:yes gene_type:complete
MRVPFSPPRMDKKMADAVVDTLYSGWITTGPKTRKLEEELTKYTGGKATVCLNSATAGLELALRWFGVKEGDEVILPAYTYCATANVVMHCGATPVLVDVKGDFNIDVSKIEAAITSRTKVIMPVDIAGMPIDYDELHSMLAKSDVRAKFAPHSIEQEKLGRIMVLADAAHSIGATYKRKNSGTLADISSFSFHAVKNLPTAEGGAVIINLPEQFDSLAVQKQFKVKSLHGQSKDALEKTKAGGWRYDITEPGYKCNMTDINAALGLVELERYDSDMLVKRKSIFDKYNALLSKYEWANIPVYKTDDKQSSFHIYMLRINNATEEQRDRIIDKISAEKVAVNVHFQPIPLLSAYKGFGFNMEDYPVAWKNYEQEISLPVFYDISDEQIGWVIDALVSAVEEVM